MPAKRKKVHEEEAASLEDVVDFIDEDLEDPVPVFKEQRVQRSRHARATAS